MCLTKERELLQPTVPSMRKKARQTVPLYRKKNALCIVPDLHQIWTQDMHPAAGLRNHPKHVSAPKVATNLVNDDSLVKMPEVLSVLLSSQL